MGIDILNINDSFFNDICYPYSEEGSDIILKDRVNDFYQNYSICDSGCDYENIDTENLTITCNCLVKTEMKTEIELPNYNEIVFDILQKSTFGVVKCYNLVFNLNKKNNIGFWIFLFFLIIHLPFIIHFFIYGYKPILKYIKRQLIIFNHSSKISNPKKKTIKNRLFNDNKKMKVNLYNIVNINNNNIPKGQVLGKSTTCHLLNDTNLYSSSIRPISNKKISTIKIVI